MIVFKSNTSTIRATVVQRAYLPDKAYFPSFEGNCLTYPLILK